jgi:Polysaccharide lyase family 8, super-sandwich domain/Polysaccharide lyase family 8, N terminal alpha-helical domain/Polysaccharide lyase family 8, C-terminal beta-sandwich domain
LAGANTSNVVLVTLIRGILAKSNAKLTQGQTRLSKVFPYVTTGDGFYRDGSYKFHGDTAYNGHYGLEQLQNVALVVNFLKGSPWAITDPNLANVYGWINDGFKPLIYHGAMMDMSRGRVSSWSNHSQEVAGAAALDAIRKVASFAPAATAASLNAFATAPRLQTGQFHFTHIDRVTSFRNGFAFGLSMSSSRITNFENLRRTSNLKGGFTGDGMTYLYVGTPDTQFTGPFWPTVDTFHLPGTTVEQTYAPEPKTTDQDWVGGAHVAGTYGVAGMALHPAASASGPSTLQGKKSWFMLDQEVVCLGAGITCSSGNAVDTTVENRRLGAVPTAGFHVDGVTYPPTIGWNTALTRATSCALDGVGGYYFPGGATNLQATVVASSGSWKQLRPGDSDATMYTDHYLKLYFKHGVQPTNASYAYVLLPGLTASNSLAYSKSHQVRIISNTPTLQAVKKPSLGVLAANFWAAGGGTVDWLTVNKAASVITREADKKLTLGISDPTQKNTGTTTVTLNRAATRLVSADSGVTVVQLTPQIIFTVQMGETQGKALQVTFAPTTTETVVNFTTSGTWTCPANVTAARVECWGGGGAGGSASAIPGSNSQNGGGGAGGAYARLDSYPVTPGAVYQVNVGTGGVNNSSINGTTVAGGDSWFNTAPAPSSQILAKGGAGGATASGNTPNHPGGMGSTAGSLGDRVTAGTSGTPGTASAPGSGGGGAEGSAAGSGGMGATSNGALKPGGLGSAGQVVLTLTLPTDPLDLTAALAAWRQFHFATSVNLGTAADAADPDGDGISNSEEFIFGTPPRSANSRPLLSASSSATGRVLTFTASPSNGTGYAGLTRRYCLEMSTNLTNPSAWTAVPGYENIIAANQAVTISQPTRATPTFYRLKAWLQ